MTRQKTDGFVFATLMFNNNVITRNHIMITELQLRSCYSKQLKLISILNCLTGKFLQDALTGMC